MKKIIAVIAALSLVAVFGAFALSANADESLGHSCGGSGVGLIPKWGVQSGGNVVVSIQWKQNCGDGKTIEVELQHDTVANPNTWVDVSDPNLDLQFSTPTNLANQLVTRTHGSSIDCTHHEWDYRVHVWWNDGNDTSLTTQVPQSC